MDSSRDLNGSLSNSLSYVNESRNSQESAVTKEEYCEQELGDRADESANTVYHYSNREIQEEYIEEEESDSETDAGTGNTKKRKLYRCRRCNKLCNSKNAFHYHFLSHTGQRPHQCEVLGKLLKINIEINLIFL